MTDTRLDEIERRNRANESFVRPRANRQLVRSIVKSIIDAPPSDDMRPVA